ncbi:MAG: metallopeptidase family protein [Propionibacteriaceae bacterium]|jgi:hypothetical protein|nr:metallopeptidase family protein [Propionibacteriaceae bacterium]
MNTQGRLRKRDRHARGMRGPIAYPNKLTGTPVPLRRIRSRQSYFMSCIASSVDRIAENNDEVLDGIDIGFEDVPLGIDPWASHVPLGSSVSARPDQRGRVVLYRRPLERRAASRNDLRRLVYRTIAEQLSAITGISLGDIAPELDD